MRVLPITAAHAIMEFMAALIMNEGQMIAGWCSWCAACESHQSCRLSLVSGLV